MRTSGTIKSIVEGRGFGFIAIGGGRDVFFHASALVGLDFDEQLVERRVEFSIADSPRGPRAENVSPAE